MIVAGIDASTNATGIAIFEDGKYLCHTLIDCHRIKDAFERIPNMAHLVCEYLDKFTIDTIIMEESVLKSNVDTVKKLAYIGGVILYYAHEHNIVFKFTLPSSWRKKIGLQNAKRAIAKQEAIRAVQLEYNMTVTDDEAESILIARSAFDLPQICITEEDVEDVIWGS